ncbi:MAG TPA: hypothetical protein VNX47_01485 [Nevskia sp.]|jgi:hypothetical protein|nr:hypothetical protein [Nevskia sp.]
MKILREPASLVLAAIPMTGLAIGVLAPFIRPERVQGYLLLAMCGLVQSFLIFLWYRLDARKRGFHRSRLLNTGMAGFTTLALPYYLLRTRGFSRGCAAIFLALLLSLGTLFMMFAGAIGGSLLSGS